MTNKSRISRHPSFFRVPQAKKWMSATLTWLRLQILTRLEHFKPSSESADYKAWQHQFLWQRLGLCLWVALSCCFTVAALDLYGAIFHLQEMASKDLKVLSVTEDLATALILFIGLILRKTPLGHRHPGVLFLCLSWCITLLPQVLGTLKGLPRPNGATWSLVFLTQATFVPVRWWLHLVSQLVPLLYFIVINSALGLTTIKGEPLFSVTLFLFVFWFYFICNLAVYLYERLQRSEFASRQELHIFLHAISHDLRTPLLGTSIVLQNLMKKSLPEVDISSAVLERLLQGNSRQLKLINSLLEAHACEVHGVVLHCEPLQLRTAITSVLSDLEPLLIQNRVILKNLVQPDLPLVNADVTQLERVFSNLMANALKHNPCEITLTLNATVKAQMMLCQVQDNGVGMSHQQCSRVFELYARGKDARFMPGLGLGLYVCRRIVTAHGGQVGVNSSLGAGSTFWFTLPLYFSRSHLYRELPL